MCLCVLFSFRNKKDKYEKPIFACCIMCFCTFCSVFLGREMDLARMTSRVNQLHDELALESVTNIEFEQSSCAQQFNFISPYLSTVQRAASQLLTQYTT